MTPTRHRSLRFKRIASSDLIRRISTETSSFTCPERGNELLSTAPCQLFWAPCPFGCQGRQHLRMARKLSHITHKVYNTHTHTSICIYRYVYVNTCKYNVYSILYDRQWPDELKRLHNLLTFCLFLLDESTPWHSPWSEASALPMQTGSKIQAEAELFFQVRPHLLAAQLSSSITGWPGFEKGTNWWSCWRPSLIS